MQWGDFVNMSRRWLVAIVLSIAAVACRALPFVPGDAADDYRMERLTAAEREELIADIETVLGTPYEWGGDERDEGFDCSGLIQWAYRRQGFDIFRNGGEIVGEITAHDLYHQNSEPVDGLAQLERGDFIFFDESGNGEINHNAVFDHVDRQGRVWVYDAYSVDDAVVHRPVEDFWSKGPLFARAHKLVRR